MKKKLLMLTGVGGCVLDMTHCQENECDHAQSLNEEHLSNFIYCITEHQTRYFKNIF